MAINVFPSPSDLIVDLTGLPEPVIRGIQQLVHVLKEKHTDQAPLTTTAEFQRATLSSAVIERSNLSLEELDTLLDELSSASSGNILPPDFSRADIYEDHD